jgi:hypothetical protein
MNYNELNYEEILRKLKPHLIKDQFQLLNKLNEILRGKIKYSDLSHVIKILSKLDEDVERAANYSIINDLISVQPMSKPCGAIFHMNLIKNKVKLDLRAL